MFPWQQLPAKETEKKIKSKPDANKTKKLIKTPTERVKKKDTLHTFKHCFAEYWQF